MQPDTEMQQQRALDAIDALQCLFESVPDGCSLEARHVAALLGLAGDAVRVAMPARRVLYGVNDPA